MIFNVIYIPGTVAQLSRFIPLLLANSSCSLPNSSCSYRLISNGCSAEEERCLIRFGGDSRCSFYRLQSIQTVPLGDALVELANVFSEEEFFCFMDSDIAVTGEFMNDFLPLLENNQAVFSGAAIWASEADKTLTSQHGAIAGPHTRTLDGVCLGSSYFGIYRRKWFDHVTRSLNVTPNKFRDLSKLDAGFLEYLRAKDLIKLDYVPPKLLNLGYAYLGVPVTYLESRHLHHIGGFSMATYAMSAGVGIGSHAEDASDVTREILTYSDQRTHMERKRSVCARLMRSFDEIDLGVSPSRLDPLEEDLEARVRLIESLYADGLRRGNAIE